ncbi:hypothetical protein [Ensifer aridi]|uniref:hypothetical protein n=1 Tax=Ensifer aridi TaxID=1708715 RepID=UPI0004073F16|nr:hypothetical protein [Ensifer aridi]
MKLKSIVIEKILPIEDQNKANTFFSVAYMDPDFDKPYFVKVTVGVRFFGDITLNELHERSLEKLHRVLGMPVPTPKELQSYVRADHLGSPPTVQ